MLDYVNFTDCVLNVISLQRPILCLSVVDDAETEFAGESRSGERMR